MVQSITQLEQHRTALTGHCYRMLGSGCRGSRLVPTMACGSPAFGQYRQDGREAFALIVLELRGDSVGAMTSFLDTATLFPRFDLPPVLAT